MKQVLSLLTLALFGVASAWAQEITPPPGQYESLSTEWVLTYGGKKFTAQEDADYRLTNGTSSYWLFVTQEDENGDPLTDKAIIVFDGRSITTPGEWRIEIPANAIIVEGTTITEPQIFKYTVKNVSNGIVEVSTDAQVRNDLYDLNGVRMKETQRGLYIVNGKKVVVRNKK